MNQRHCNQDCNCSRALDLEDLKRKRDEAIENADHCGENGDYELANAYYKTAMIIMERIMDEM